MQVVILFFATLTGMVSACVDSSDCPAGQICTAGVCGCPPGSFFWTREGVNHCQQCLPGCACPGGYDACYGCSDGLFSGASAAVCSVCAPGFTSDAIYNVGCDPENYLTPCANQYGPLGQATCRPIPPPSNTTFVAPNGALYAPPQYLPGGPPYVPNKVSPYYDIDGQPMIQQSY